MGKIVIIFILLAFSLLFIACESEGNTNEISWGDTATTETLKITPIDIQVGTFESQLEEFEVTETGQVVVIYLELENTSDSTLTLDRDFYYDSFGVFQHLERLDVRTTIQMDTDAFLFQGVYLGNLEKGEKVNTRLILYTGIGEVLKLVYSDDGNLTSRYDVSWDVQ